MGYIAFCALETNGTTLPVGIISGFLKTKKGCRFFHKSICKDGMYFTLLCRSIIIAKSRQTSVHGSSVNPRHVGHNRSYYKNSTNLVAGIPEHFGGYDPTISNDDEDQFMKSHCAQIEKKMISLCARTTASSLKKKEDTEVTEQQDVDQGRKKKDLLNEFLDEVKDIAGKGCSGMYSLNFLQLAGYFGFVPIKILATSTVENKVSGGYKYIESLYPGISPKKAQQFFTESVQIIQDIFGKSFTFAFAENMLCELYRDRNGTNPKKDVTFFFDHRSNQWSGLQNFFRLKVNSGLSMNLEMLGVPQSKNAREGSIKLMSWTNGLTSQKGPMKWMHLSSDNSIQSTIGYKSELSVSKEICTYYTMVHSLSGKRKRTEFDGER